MNDEQYEDFNEYQQIAHSTAIYPPETGLYYTALGLAGEAGELCNKVKKILRDKGGVLDAATRAALVDEASDCCWYIAEFSTAIGVPLSAVIRRNVEKLSDRARRGKLSGEGDAR